MKKLETFEKKIELSEAKKLLLGLEKSGQFVFHGSSRELGFLEPRQPYSLDEKTGKLEKDGGLAVCATPYAEIAIFASIVNSENTSQGHRSSYGVEKNEQTGQPIIDCRASEKTMEQINEKELVGFVYVFKKEDFYERDSMEWRSEKEITPIQIVAVGKKDLPEKIGIINEKIA